MSGPFGDWPGKVDGAYTGEPTTQAILTDGDGQPTTQAIVAEIDNGIPYWEEAPDLWDQVTIAGFTFPGVANVAGEPKRKLDKKNAKGADGRTITDDGADGVDIEVVVQIWNSEQWYNYQLAIPFIDPNQQKGKLLPVDIIHPALKLHNIRSMYVESMTLPQTCGIPQVREVRIKATSWAPPPKTPKKSKSKTPDESSESKDQLIATETTYIRDDDGNLIATEVEGIYRPAGEDSGWGYDEEYEASEGVNTDP
jgi:hypothetical protein